MIDWWSTGFGQSEIDSISEAIHNKNISQGKINTLLEENFAKALNVKFAVTSPNGTQAILIALHSVGVRGGDEVIVSSLTAIGTANAIFGLGGKPIFVDSSWENPNLDVKKIEEKISNKTKAILIVHYNGISVDMDAVIKISNKFGIPVIEDAAQAMFSKSKNQYLGTFLNAGTFSFAVSKIISSGQGGITVTNDEKLYNEMKRLKIQDRDEYDSPTFNMKFTDIQASMLIPQLNEISKKIVKLKEIYQMYATAFKDLKAIEMVGNANEPGELPLWAIAKCQRRDELYNFLVANDIRPLKWPRPLNEAKWFQAKGDFPNASYWSSQGLRLPCGPARNFDDIKKTIDIIHKFYQR